MDCFGAKRSQLLAVVEKAIQGGASKLKDKKSGQMNLFDDFEEVMETVPVVLPDIPEFPDREKSVLEKEVLGFYLTSHPLSEHASILQAFCSHTSASAKNAKNGDEVLMGGMISSIKHAHIRNPRPGQSSKYANFDLEDMDGYVRSICWPGDFEQCGDNIQPDAVVLARGVIERRGDGDEINFKVSEVIPIADADTKFTTGIHILFDQTKHEEDLLDRIREILRGYPGQKDVMLAVKLTSGETVHVKALKQKVDVAPELRTRLDDLLGTPSHKLLMVKPKMKTGMNQDRFRRANA
jgi:DNA polymerase III subunit alpha